MIDQGASGPHPSAEGCPIEAKEDAASARSSILGPIESQGVGAFSTTNESLVSARLMGPFREFLSTAIGVNRGGEST